ncbi:MAG: DUF3343 domain-containing protein [Deltaproteobacteria bacterium]|nr:DUF3343 domain-containing protein [Deltaproteobacteria bacterium]
MAFFGLLKKKSARPSEITRSRADRGILIFENTTEVIQAETILKREGFEFRVMGPPPEVQRGCDLVIEFPLIEELNIMRILGEAKLSPLEAVPVTGPLLKPVDLFHTKDFGRYLMVRAANMKVTVDKDTGLIVNVSGGGCPDVPYLAGEMVGHKLFEAPNPREMGHTLCGYALYLAYKEVKRQCSV